MKQLVALIVCMTYINMNAQKRNDVWVFGDSAGIDFANKINPTAFTSSAKSRGTAVSIANTNGDLLFYGFTRAGLGQNNTGQIFDKINLLMQNGDNIIGRAWYYEYVIVPFPNDTNKFYLFHTGVTVIYGLYYTIIDMTLNNGLGAVTQKNIQINNLPANDGLTAVQHGNGRDWWLIFKDNDGVADNTFYKYIVDTSGVALVDTQNIGSTASTNTIRLNFNKTGTRLSTINYSGVTDIFDFDRCTGQLSNYQLIKNFTFPPIAEFWGSEFSANGRFLYIATSGYYNAAYLIQVDLLNPQLYAAADTIDSIYTVSTPGGALKRGPDDKIYWSCAYFDGFNFPYPYPDTLYNTYNTYLSVINSPDSLGAACNFTPYSFYLGGARTYWGLPNNPDYDLGPLKGSACDTLTLLTPTLSKGEGVMQITYISAWEKLFVNASGLQGKNVTVSIYDGRGRAIKNYELKIINGYATVDVDCTGWSDGLYVVHLKTEKEILTKKFIKE